MVKKSDIYPCYYLPMHNRKQVVFLILTLLLIASTPLTAQPSWTLDPFGKEKKPEVYEEKVLASEKTATKKFTPMRRFLHNTTTHYNYFFNANNKLNAVIERATLSNQDDFTKLLTYYPYSLENTATQQVELDSVIYKSGAGILLHDLRSDWVDNMYLLIGKAYLLRKELDSAALTFQFINYNLFPRKKNNDDDRVVGSNLNVDEKNRAFSIADKENRNVLKKAFTRAPSRNESLLWLIRTFIEQKNLGEAAGLINILQNDPNFPKRLHNDLSVLAGYWFFQQNVYDSAAVYLENGLSHAANKQNRARWEFLLGQMYEMTGHFDKASHFYAKSAKHTVSPVMDIYANLNNAKMMRVQGDEKELKNRIARLVKMSKKDKYESYRDIIFYAAAQLTMDVPDTTAAMDLYAKSIFRYNEANAGYKSKAYLEMANIRYHQRDYKNAASYYDSIKIEDTAFLTKQAFDIEERKVTLKKLVGHLLNIEAQDSLQMVAAMPEPQREEYIRKLVKQLRKEKGQKEDESADPGGAGALISFGKDKDKPRDLFESNNTKGEWYFYNNSLRTKGAAEFATKWGKRTNIDNWRRVAGVARNDNNGMMPSGTLDSLRKAEEDARQLISYESLLKGLPLTPEALDSSNNIIAENLIALALLFQFELDDTEQAINMYELYLERFPDKLADGEVYLGLYYAYNKLGNFQKANYYKDLLNSRFPNSVANKKITDPESLDPDRVDPAVTREYENIYNLFIEGNFDEALSLKNAADQKHGSMYWTPQLLYIEAVYHIKQRDDSTAIKVLNRLSVLYPNTPMQQKAIALIDVLGRRAEIEGYLSALQVERAEEPLVVVPEDSTDVPAPRVVQEEKKIEPVVVQPKEKPVEPVIKEAPVKQFTDGEFTLEPNAPHYVIMVLNKVDGVFQNEARNAFSRYNRELFNRMNLKVEREGIDADRALLVTSTFENADQAMLYFEKIKQAAPREVSWLPASKYYFLIIDENSLQLLRSNKKLDAYRALLNSAHNNKF